MPRNRCRNFRRKDRGYDNVVWFGISHTSGTGAQAIISHLASICTFRFSSRLIFDSRMLFAKSVLVLAYCSRLIVYTSYSSIRLICKVRPLLKISISQKLLKFLYQYPPTLRNLPNMYNFCVIHSQFTKYRNTL